MSNELVKILWTGGWDSTFRMIQLSRCNSEIQPYYVVDTARSSSLKEIQQMQKIKKQLSVKYPNCKIHDVNFIELSSITVHSKYSEAHARLNESSFMGSQYIWLAALASTINDLELCIHRDDKAEVFVEKLRQAQCELLDEKLIFGDLKFPILDYTKLRMEEESRKSGDLEILNQSWFCFDPINDSPCGFCNPCIYSLQEGMAKRFSLRAKMYSKAPRVAGRIRRILRKVI